MGLNIRIIGLQTLDSVVMTEGPSAWKQLVFSGTSMTLNSFDKLRNLSLPHLGDFKTPAEFPMSPHLSSFKSPDRSYPIFPLKSLFFR